MGRDFARFSEKSGNYGVGEELDKFKNWDRLVFIAAVQTKHRNGNKICEGEQLLQVGGQVP